MVTESRCLVYRGEDKDVYAAAIYSAKHDTVKFITAQVVTQHAGYFAQNCAWFRSAINPELAGALAGAHPMVSIRSAVWRPGRRHHAGVAELTRGCGSRRRQSLTLRSTVTIWRP